MAARSIASLSLTFGLVSIPVKLYSATDSSAGVHFNLLHKTCGSRLKQQYFCLKENVPVERAEMVKGYEFEKDRYVMFTPDELRALEDKGTQSVDIVSFIPLSSVDPIYYDKAYYLAPDKRGARRITCSSKQCAKPRCALAKWVWKGKQYMVQVRVGAEGLILQQLLYATEVRSMKELEIEKTDVKKPELNLALQLIEQIAEATYDPAAYEDEERSGRGRNRRKDSRQAIAVSAEPEPGTGQVIDLMGAARQSREEGAGSGSRGGTCRKRTQGRQTCRRNARAHCRCGTRAQQKITCG
jgi:DNA end-binding protein Ku